jgi:hypothetical protein
MVAGSDSHSVRAGKTFTAAYAKNKEEFLNQIMQKNSFVFGRHGSPAVLQSEFADKFMRYDNLILNKEPLFPAGSRFHRFVFQKIGKYAGEKLNEFVGGAIERENGRIVLKYMKKAILSPSASEL